MNARPKRTFILILGLLVSAFFLWLAIRNTNPNEIRNAVIQADWKFAPAVLFSLCVYFAVKTYRWKYLLLPIANIRLRSLFPVVVVGYASNLLLPAQMGELVRTYLAGRKYSVAASPVLVTVIVERMFDFLTILIFVGFILLSENDMPRELILAGYLCGAVGSAMLAGVVTHIFRPQYLTSLFKALTSAFPKAIRPTIMGQFEQATKGLESLRDPKLFLTISLSSVAQWLLMGICTYLSILALGLDAPFSAAFVVLAVVVVGMTIPSSPGFFGTIQLCFTIGLTPYGVETGKAVAASIYFHGILFVAVAIAGALFARYLGFSPSDLIRSAESQ